MPLSKEQQAGLDYESVVAESLGLEQVPGSGSQWHSRSDVRGRGLRVSAKSNPTTRRSWGQTRSQLSQAVDLAAGTGELPALAVEDSDGAKLVLMRLEDLAALLGTDQGMRPLRRSETVRSVSRIPVLLREG